MRFADGLQARDIIRAQAIEDGREIHFKRVSKNQMEAFYKDPCEWIVFCSVVKVTGHFIIKIVDGPHLHNCNEEQANFFFMGSKRILRCI